MRVLVFTLLCAAACYGACTADDKDIYDARGKTFPHVFRQLGGISVTENAYVEAVVGISGLSTECAQCYGKAYICGKYGCPWSCRRESIDCTECLKGEHCLSEWARCTGWST